MPEVETRYPCPVCLGVSMDKTRISARGDLVLDSCRRCGGIWFELGEVQRLKRLKPQALWDRVGGRGKHLVTQCHACHAPFDRDAAACPACGRANTIVCPICDRTMEVHVHDGVRLDVCRECKGLWFDHAELAQIWKLALERSGRPRTLHAHGSTSVDAYTGAAILADALMFSPELVVYGARAAGYAVVSSGEVLANAPEAAASVVSGLAEAAASVFEAVLDIVSDMF